MFVEGSFSQCRRLDVALDYVLDSFQLEHGRFYEAFIKVRPDVAGINFWDEGMGYLA